MKRMYFIIILSFLVNTLKASDPDTAFNAMFRRDIGGWIAADATYSIFLPDGRTLWLFGDTFIGEVNGIKIVSGAVMIRNSAVIQDGDNLSTLYSGTASSPLSWILTDDPDSTWYWPEHGMVIHDTLWIFVSKFREKNNGAAGFNFEQTGNDIAYFSYPALEFLGSEPVPAYAGNQVIYGDRVMEDSIFLYIYGRRADNAEGNIPYPHVARFPYGSPLDEEWEYYTGSGWSDAPGESAPMDGPAVSQQYGVFNHLGTFVMLTQEIWLSPEIYTCTSDAPEGPWKNKTKVYTTPETGGTTFTYNAYVHPQFDRNRELLVSYNVNGDFWSIFSNVELYRPRFIRVPYMNISYDFWPNTIRSNTTASVKIFPNPAREVLHISFSSPQSGTPEFVVMDLYGRIIFISGDYTLMEGGNCFSVRIEDLDPGIYAVQVRIKNQQHTIPFVKVN